MAKFRNSGGTSCSKKVAAAASDPEQSLIQQIHQRLAERGADGLSRRQRREARRLGVDKVFPDRRNLSSRELQAWERKYGTLFI